MKKNEAIDEIRNQKNELLKGKERRDKILSTLLQIQQTGQQQSNMIMQQIRKQQAFTNMLLMKIFNLKPETQTERTYQEQRSEVREEWLAMNLLQHQILIMTLILNWLNWLNICHFGLMILISVQIIEEQSIIYPTSWELMAFTTNVGMGRGKVKHTR